MSAPTSTLNSAPKYTATMCPFFGLCSARSKIVQCASLASCAYFGFRAKYPNMPQFLALIAGRQETALPHVSLVPLHTLNDNLTSLVKLKLICAWCVNKAKQLQAQANICWYIKRSSPVKNRLFFFPVLKPTLKLVSFQRGIQSMYYWHGVSLY